jgi:hypothetical protein
VPVLMQNEREGAKDPYCLFAGHFTQYTINASLSTHLIGILYLNIGQIESSEACVCCARQHDIVRSALHKQETALKPLLEVPCKDYRLPCVTGVSQEGHIAAFFQRYGWPA